MLWALHWWWESSSGFRRKPTLLQKIFLPLLPSSCCMGELFGPLAHATTRGARGGACSSDRKPGFLAARLALSPRQGVQLLTRNLSDFCFKLHTQSCTWGSTESSSIQTGAWPGSGSTSLSRPSPASDSDSSVANLSISVSPAGLAKSYLHTEDCSWKWPLSQGQRMTQGLNSIES